MSVDELRTWVATVSEQNTRFMDLERLAHRQEIELTGPATTYIAIAAIFSLAVVGLLVFWLRDANAAAATTLENAAALAPEEMMRSLVVAGLAKSRPITVVVKEPNHKRLDGPTKEPAIESPR